MVFHSNLKKDAAPVKGNLGRNLGQTKFGTDIFSFTERFLLMAYQYDRNKKLEPADAVATKTGVCGDTVTIYLGVEGEKISVLTYELNGCIPTNACCNSLAEMSVGWKIDLCWKITHEDIINDLKTLPEDHLHCAELVVGTFYLALSQLC